MTRLPTFDSNEFFNVVKENSEFYFVTCWYCGKRLTHKHKIELIHKFNSSSSCWIYSAYIQRVFCCEKHYKIFNNMCTLMDIRNTPKPMLKVK